MSVLSQILPAGVRVSEMDLGAEPEPLFASEAVLVERAVHKRRHEFAAGRSCARKALRELGFAPVEILANEDRSPVWPKGVVGSITHTGGPTQGWCGAAVGAARDWQGIGIDAELASPLGNELRPRILTVREAEFLAKLPEAEASLLAKVVFSAKEAFYKCQYPATRVFLGFHAVELVLDPSSSSFQIGLVEGIAEGDFEEETRERLACVPRLEGRYRLSGGLIVTAVCWAKVLPPQP